MNEKLNDAICRLKAHQKKPLTKGNQNEYESWSQRTSTAAVR